MRDSVIRSHPSRGGSTGYLFRFQCFGGFVTTLGKLSGDDIHIKRITCISDKLLLVGTVSCEYYTEALTSSPYLSKLITFGSGAHFKTSRRSANVDCGQNLTPFSPATTSKRCITELCGAPEEIAVTTSPHFAYLTLSPVWETCTSMRI